MAANRKLSVQDVQFIRLTREFLSTRDLAANFGVSVQTINDVVAGRTWRHVELPSFPPRSLAEAKQEGREVIQKALNMLLKIRADCIERRIPEPPSLDQAVKLIRFCETRAGAGDTKH